MRNLKSIVTVEQNKNFGSIKLKLKEFLDSQNIARSKIANMTGLQYSVVNRYYSKAEFVQRLDFEVIAKICFVLDCDLSDILEYEKPSQG